MTPENFRSTCALMLERLGHTVIGDPSVGDADHIQERIEVPLTVREPVDPIP